MFIGNPSGEKSIVEIYQGSAGIAIKNIDRLEWHLVRRMTCDDFLNKGRMKRFPSVLFQIRRRNEAHFSVRCNKPAPAKAGAGLLQRPILRASPGLYGRRKTRGQACGFSGMNL
jgi:hypothetical protein